MGIVWKRPPPAAASGQVPGSGLPPAPPPELPESRVATVVFIMGILGVILCCLPLGPAALLIGGQERKEVKAGRVAPSDLLTAGWVLGIVGTVLFAIVITYAIYFLTQGAQVPPGGT